MGRLPPDRDLLLITPEAGYTNGKGCRRDVAIDPPQSFSGVPPYGYSLLLFMLVSPGAYFHDLLLHQISVEIDRHNRKAGH